MRTKNLSCKLVGIAMVFMLFSYSSFCQVNYSAGYIINLNNDTIRGYIDYRNWEKNPTTISFKTNLNEKEINYHPLDIKSFSVMDEIYESAIIERANRINQIVDWDETSELNIVTDTAYLQTIIKGNKSLYYLKDRNYSDNFYIKQENSFNLLIFKRYLQALDDADIIIENKKFIGQLTVYLQDCPGIQNKLKDIKYNKSALEKVFLFYYKNTKTTKEFHKKTEKTILEIGMLAGISNTTLEFIGNNDYLTNFKFKSTNNISAGLSCEFIIARNQRKWSINNELIYTTYQFSGHHDDYYNPTDIEIGFTYFKINNMFRYKYPIGNLYPFINFGISNGFTIGEVNNKVATSTFHTPTYSLAFDLPRKYEQGYLGGIGLKYKNFSIEFRMERGNGFSDQNNLRTPTKRFYCFLGYQF